MASSSSSALEGPRALASSDSDSAAFVRQHSERYRALASDDSLTTVEGCFPPDEMIPRARVMALLGVLARLWAEDGAMPTANPYRIFRVRDRFYYEALNDASSAEDIEALRTLVDYLLLPKALLAMLDLHCDVEAAKGEYRAALSGYDPATALHETPRLLEYLDTDKLRPVVERAFIAIDGGKGAVLRKLWPNWIGCNGSDQNAIPFQAVHQAFLDGLMGEPAVAYEGVQPGQRRLCFYSAGCVAVGRPIPYELFPGGVLFPPGEDPFYRSLNGLHTTELIASPSRMAALQGKVAVLQEMRDRGWDFSSEWHDILSAAVDGGKLTPIQWVQSLTPGECHSFRWDFCFDIRACHFPDIASWVMQRPAIWAKIQRRASLEEPEWFLANVVYARNLPLVKAIHAQGFPVHCCVVSNFVEIGDAEGAKWAREQGARVDCHVLTSALHWGHWDSFVWALAELGSEPRSSSELGFAVQGFRGDLTVLDRLVALGSPTTPEALAKVARYAGYCNLTAPLEWLQRLPQFRGWLVEREATRQAFSAAVGYAHTDVMRWLIEATKDHPDTLKGIKDIGVGYGTKLSVAFLELMESLYDLSAFYHSLVRCPMGDVSLMRWLAAKGYRVPADFPPHLVFRLFEKGLSALPVLQCLEECGLELSALKGNKGELTAVCDAAARGGSVDMMLHARSKGCQWDNNTLLEAALANKRAMLRWLREQEPSWVWPKDLVSKARSVGADECAQWACEHGAGAGADSTTNALA